MAVTYRQVQQLAHELPLEERVILANDLLADAGPDTFAGDDAAWDAEIARRVAEIKAGTAETCSMEELEADWRSILGE
jgi:putative addiction module component (TIGR02574 family)